MSIRRARIVVVTWNGAHLLPACLDSLRRQAAPGWELETVVVDNASTDGTEALLRTRYPDVTVLEAPTNLGFAGGMALATRGYAGDAVVLLNNDATFDDGAVAALLAALDGTGPARVGAATATVLLEGRYVRRDSGDGWRPAAAGEDGVVLLNSTGNVVGRDGSGGDRDWLVPSGDECAATTVFGFHGGAAALRWAAAEAVGGFDAELFLYYEDTDLSWRLRARGWDVVHVPQAVARHRHGASSDPDSPLFRYYNTRNWLIVTTRHAPIGVVALAWLRAAAGLVLATARRDPRGLLGARGRGVRDAARRLPRTVRERRSLWRGAARSRRAAMDG